MTHPATILALSTSTHRYESSGRRTGLWLGELTHVYDALKKAGHRTEIASVAGGQVPIDPVSLLPPVLAMGGTHRRYADPRFMSLLDSTPSVAQVDLARYDGIFLAGGHGAMFDFPTPEVARLVGAFADAGKIVAAVCHGPAGLLGVPVAGGGTLLQGRRATGFCWAEEAAALRTKDVPFRLEDRLRAEAGEYTKAALPMGPHVVVDGSLVTGQNPTSASGVGKAIVELLAARD